MDFQFQSNVIQHTNFPIRFIVSPDFRLRIIDLKFPNPIECPEALKLEHNQFLREFGDTVYFRIGKPYDSSAPYYSLSNILSEVCVVASHIIAIVSVVAVLIFILIVVVTAVFYRYLLRRERIKQLNVIRPEGKTYRETQIVVQIENAGLLKTDL